MERGSRCGGSCPCPRGPWPQGRAGTVPAGPASCSSDTAGPSASPKQAPTEVCSGPVLGGDQGTYPPPPGGLRLWGSLAGGGRGSRAGSTREGLPGLGVGAESPAGRAGWAQAESGTAHPSTQGRARCPSLPCPTRHFPMERSQERRVWAGVGLSGPRPGRKGGPPGKGPLGGCGSQRGCGLPAGLPAGHSARSSVKAAFGRRPRGGTSA